MSSSNRADNSFERPMPDSAEALPKPRLVLDAGKTSKSLRLLVVDDQLLVRAGICELVKLMPGVEVVAQAGDGREALRLIATYRPDLVVMNILMPGMNGLEATVLAKQRFPKVKIILLAEKSNEQFLARILRSGADGFVLKDAPVAQLHTAIRAAGEGRQLDALAAAEKFIDVPKRPAPDAESIKITGRQHDVLRLIGEGKSTKEIAKLLHISVNTVKTHRLKLMEKLGVHEITGVVRYAVKLGLINN
jgi:DNA-binding NarL/FixJ family response regulator